VVRATRNLMVKDSHECAAGPAPASSHITTFLTPCPHWGLFLDAAKGRGPTSCISTDAETAAVLRPSKASSHMLGAPSSENVQHRLTGLRGELTRASASQDREPQSEVRLEAFFDVQIYRPRRLEQFMRQMSGSHRWAAIKPSTRAVRHSVVYRDRSLKNVGGATGPLL